MYLTVLSDLPWKRTISFCKCKIFLHHVARELDSQSEIRIQNIGFMKLKQSQENFSLGAGRHKWKFIVAKNLPLFFSAQKYGPGSVSIEVMNPDPAGKGTSAVPYLLKTADSSLNPVNVTGTVYFVAVLWRWTRTVPNGGHVAVKVILCTGDQHYIP